MIIKNRNGEFQYIDNLLNQTDLIQEKYHNDLLLKYTERYLHLLKSLNNPEDNVPKQAKILKLIAQSVKDNPSNIQELINHLISSQKTIIQKLNAELDLFKYFCNNQDVLISTLKSKEQKEQSILLLNNFYAYYLQNNLMIEKKGFKIEWNNNFVLLDYEKHDLNVLTNIQHNEKTNTFFLNFDFQLNLNPFNIYTFIREENFGIYADYFISMVLPTLLYKSYLFYDNLLKTAGSKFKISAKTLHNDSSTDEMSSCLTFSVSIPFQEIYIDSHLYDLLSNIENILVSYNRYLKHCSKFIYESRLHLEYHLQETFVEWEDWESFDSDNIKKSREYMKKLNKIKNPLLNSIVHSIEQDIESQIRFIYFENNSPNDSSYYYY